MTDLYLLWSGFGPETKAAIIGAVSTLGVGIIGFGGLILQMRSQSKQSRDAIAENERRRLKAAMYEDAVANCRQSPPNFPTAAYFLTPQQVSNTPLLSRISVNTSSQPLMTP